MAEWRHPVVPDIRSQFRAGHQLVGEKFDRIVAPSTAGVHAKYEVTFNIPYTSATNLQYPYDASPPNGITPRIGISVWAEFTDPSANVWQVPAFYAQHFDTGIQQTRDWVLPRQGGRWFVRFAPHVTGTWSCRLRATDADGSWESRSWSFLAEAVGLKGSIRVCSNDARYFTYADGSLFTGLGHHSASYLDDPATVGKPALETAKTKGIGCLRMWMSAIFGTAWTPWIGARNQYTGYLPITGAYAFDNGDGTKTLTTRVDYEVGGDTGWFDATRAQFWDDPDSIKPNTPYYFRAEYRGQNIAGPRNGADANYGLVLKLNSSFVGNAHDYGSGGTVVTTYGRNNSDWGAIEGTWTSGASEHFLPKLHVSLYNVTQGEAYVRLLSVQEIVYG